MRNPILFFGYLFVMFPGAHTASAQKANIYAAEGRSKPTCYHLDSILAFTLYSGDTVLEQKEFFSYDSLCRTSKFARLVWERDRWNTQGHWAKESMYTQKFDFRDSLIERINYEGRCENDESEDLDERVWLWHKTTREEWQYTRQPVIHTAYSVKDWNPKTKKWQLKRKDGTSLNEQGKTLCRIFRDTYSDNLEGWQLSKKEFIYDTTGKTVASTNYGSFYRFPFWKKITDFPSTDTFVAEGKAAPVTWWTSFSDTFIYNNEGKIRMQVNFDVNRQPITKDSFTYANNGLTRYKYSTQYDAKAGKWRNSNALTVTTYDNDGNISSVEDRYPDFIEHTAFRYDSHRNIVFEEQRKKITTTWELTYKYTRHYEYDTNGRLLTDKYYSWPNATDSTLSEERQFKYDTNGNALLAIDPHRESFEAIYDDDGHMLFKRRGDIFMKYYYSKK